ncbi:hypothetical protein CY35_07G022300 [Sphagnum magellanicum]|uniref:Uncharacterized protein n=1 Tax=Sphagnum magellanicum TaxID=128215 RepID=A0ACB8HJF5_9BRYO|nr:hypothetical protein CY35_07G022300 [Sphagnum magellanicum]
MKSPPSSGSRPPRLMAPVTSSSHELQLLIPSPQFDVDDPHAEVLILLFLCLVLLVRLARELVKLLRYLRKLRREFAARGREPIGIPHGHDAQLQAVVVEANTSSRGVSSRIVEAMGIAVAGDALQDEGNDIKVE